LTTDPNLPDLTSPSSDYPCPCGSGKELDACHKATEERLSAAIHEIGHACSLPKNSSQHVSFLKPCPHCQDEGEAKPCSVAHTSYSGKVDFSTYGLLLYNLAGGASEIACGVLPTWKKFDVGEYPASMEQDFKDLKRDCDSRGLDWEAIKSNIGPCFLIVVEHFNRHVSEIRKLALQLIAEQGLTHEQVNLGFLNREQLLTEMEAE
jgi:SEC-C motif